MKCLSYTVGIITDQILRHEALVTVEFAEFYDPDTGESWRFLAEPEQRVELILKLAEGLPADQRREVASKLTPIEIVSGFTGRLHER